MKNDQQPPDDETTISARGDLVSAFAGYLTQHMLDAITADDNNLRWEEVVLAAAMACRAIGHVATIMTAKETGKEPDQQATDQRIAAIMAKAHNIKLVAMRVNSMDEADAYMDGVAKGFH
jgi:thiamine kinase-like enzyme